MLECVFIPTAPIHLSLNEIPCILRQTMVCPLNGLYCALSSCLFSAYRLDRDTTETTSTVDVDLNPSLKEIISQTDLYLVILSLKTHVFEDKLTKY